MANNDYHFITQWRVASTCQEVTGLLGNGPDLMRWWPSVYLGVKKLQEGDENGVGTVIDLYTKGLLPYTLRWQFTVGEAHHPNGFTLHAQGDFVGRGIWTFEQDGPFVNITYDWQISAEKPLLKKLSFLIKPIFAKNHEWAMARGYESLQLELARRHAKTDEERARIPSPPPPTTTSPLPLLLGTVAAVVALLYGVSRLFWR